jgi:hypothetical protein
MRSDHGTAHQKRNKSLHRCPGQPSTTSPATGDSKVPGHGFAIPLRLQAPGPSSHLDRDLTLALGEPAKRGLAKSLAMITRTLPANRGQDKCLVRVQGDGGEPTGGRFAKWSGFRVTGPLGEADDGQLNLRSVPVQEGSRA